jgi:hypothetical protein
MRDDVRQSFYASMAASGVAPSNREIFGEKVDDLQRYEEMALKRLKAVTKPDDLMLTMLSCVAENSTSVGQWSLRLAITTRHIDLIAEIAQASMLMGYALACNDLMKENIQL